MRAPGHRGPWRRRERRQARVVLVAAAMVAMALATISAPTAAGPPAGNEWLEGRRILNLAHGGGLKEAPEGTLFAYKTAAERGATALEMDLHITLDGHVVAIHDSTVDRTTDGTGCVVAKTLAELKALDAAHRFVPGRGPTSSEPPEAYLYRGIATGAVAPPPGFTANDFTIATLEEIFKAVPDALMVMELKPTEVYQTHDCPAFVESLPPDERPDLVAEVARLIDEYDMTDKVMVASFIDDLMHRFNALAPEVDTSFPLGESLDVYFAYLAGDPLPNPYGHEAFQVPTSYGSIEIGEEIVHYAREHGVAVHYWTINDPDEMHELLDWGADGLITDVPQVLDQVLAERGDPAPVVGSATTLTVSPADPTAPGEPVTFTATVASTWPNPEPTGTVELRSGDTVLATAELSGGTATVVIDDLPTGEHEVVAAYLGSARVAPSTSPPVVHGVVEPATTSTTSTTAPPDGGPSTTVTPAGASPSTTAPAGAGGAGAPSGAGSLPATGAGLAPAALGLALVVLGGAVLGGRRVLIRLR